MIMETAVLIFDTTFSKVPRALSSHMMGRRKVPQMPRRFVNRRKMQWISKLGDHSPSCDRGEVKPPSSGLDEPGSLPQGDAEIADVSRKDSRATRTPEPASPSLSRATKAHLHRHATYQKQLMAKRLSVIKEQVATFMGPRENGDIRDVILMSFSFAVLVYISQRLVCAYCLLRSMAQHF